MISDIRQPSFRLSEESRLLLTEDLLKVLTEDWGGPRNPMAQSYYRQVVVPDLVNCLEINLHALSTSVFPEILANKLNTQFGFPPTFASGLATDMVDATSKWMANSSIKVDNFEPWERLFRKLSIGEAASVIAERTGFSQDYVELIHKRYSQFIKLVKEQGPKSFNSLTNTELIECGEQLLQFMYRFWQRFDHPHYLERLKAEDIAYQLGLSLEPEEVLASLVVIHDFEYQADCQQIAQLLKSGSSPKGQNLELYTGSWPLKAYSLPDIEYFIKGIHEHGFINIDASGKVSLATKSAQLVGSLLSARLVTSVMENIMPGTKSADEAVELLRNLNVHVLEKVIAGLARTGSPEIIEVLQRVPQIQNKRIYLKVLGAFGEIGSPRALNFVINAVQHRDAMIRARACKALGTIGDSSGYFALVRCLDDNVPAVKEQALIAIGKLGHRSALKKIAGIADNLEENIHVRHVALEVLAQIKLKD